MKNTLLKRLVLALPLVLGATALTIAHESRGPGHHAGHSSPARHEVRAYMEANVLPVLRQQRQKLETQLAPADQQAIAGYRAQLKALGAQGKELRQSIMPEGFGKGTRPTLTDDQKAQVQSLRSQSRTIMLSVAQLAQKYDANIQQLAKEVEPRKAQWTTDLKAIVQKSTTPEQQEKIAKWQGHEQHHSELRKFFRPAAFLLLEPTAPAAETATLSGTSLYPNPAVATTQLQYDVRKAGTVRIDLLDGTGNQLRTLAPDATQEAGTHTQQLDLSDLPKGTYFYKITTKSGTETKRFVKE